MTWNLAIFKINFFAICIEPARVLKRFSEAANLPAIGLHKLRFTHLLESQVPANHDIILAKLSHVCELLSNTLTTRRPAYADRTARRQFQAVFPVITGSFTSNVIAHLRGLSMDLTVGRTVGPTVDSTVG